MNKSKKVKATNFSSKSTGRNNSKNGYKNLKLASYPDPLLLWGRHAVTAALENPLRRIYEVFFTESNQDKIHALIKQGPFELENGNTKFHVVPSKELAALLPENSVHQGIAAIVKPLEPEKLDYLINETRKNRTSFVVVLDQVTDPHNLGAVIRSAAAFSADAIIVHDRSTPRLDGVLGKAASGALEQISIVRIKNIARAIEQLKKNGFWCLGLSDSALNDLSNMQIPPKTALVLGAEGMGLRRLTRDTCDELARLPTSSNFPTLNISNAASISFYEIRRQWPFLE